ncbi:biopolymer transporter ExbD [Prolixibacteraceae bacterium JC049]|nr:biopolymer transporter ExbD [Prolixibacteraceae bacterium JC049]
MSKFRKNGGKELPPISTASLPDIVFMILFFFMVSTTMREQELKVKVNVPQATELTKLEKKSLVCYLYIGPPQRQFVAKMGNAERIQLNDKFATKADIPAFIQAERDARDEAERPFMVYSLKVDENTPMLIVGEVKQELRKMAALSINYSAKKAVER